MSARLHAQCGDEKVWNEITQLAQSHRAVHLDQGAPDFSPPKFLVDAFCRAVSGGPMMHQYTRPFGHLSLVKNLAKFFSRVIEREIDPLQDILVTVGAYHAVFCALQALIAKGDEVIIIEPHFECHRPTVAMAGGKPVYVPLRPKNSGSSSSDLSSGDWVLSAEELASKFTPRTKAIVINTPNNPLGKVYKKEELEMIAELCTRHDVLCISDETYEWLTYDDARHFRIDVDFKDQSSGAESYDSRFVKWLTEEKGLAAIPVSLFFSPEHRKSFDRYVRFCFVKEDSTLDAAMDILKKWSD